MKIPSLLFCLHATYKVERSSSLAPGQWQTLQNDVQGDGTAKTYTDNDAVSSSRIYYRIGVSP